MRYKSKVKNGYCIYAVAGTNTVSFAIDSANANTKGLLGFSVKRTYPPSGETYYMPGFKIFGDPINEKPDSQVKVSTEDHPVQSFVWDDFTLKPDQEYTYYFEPVKGSPKLGTDGRIEGLTHDPAIEIKIKSEPLFSNEPHDVFFNRGVASSQAYAREFGNVSPDKLIGKEKQDAFQWLGRDLDDAIYKFIAQAKKGDTLLCCFYEFHYKPVLDALKAAIDLKVDVKIIIDAKKNGKTDKSGKKGKDFPRDDNLATIKAANIPLDHIIKREANPNLIQHNKFMVFLKGKSKTPTAVWTGSTNISENGIYGHTNVGHWVRDKEIAASYRDYWNLMSTDPGKGTGAAAKTARKKYQQAAEALQKDILPAKIGTIPEGVIPIFSPRTKVTMLTSYFTLVDQAAISSNITLAFGINADLKQMLLKHDANSGICFMLLEKEDKANKRAKAPFVPVGAKNNVYKAFGSYLKDPLYKWVKETNTQKFGMATHVVYIHSKFLLKDPLSAAPVVVTGSANFSTASTTGNDENMIIIKGDQRAADIYFTEFNRLFNHYYFRSVHQLAAAAKTGNESASLFLDTTDGWLQKYKPGLLKYKRVMLFKNMKNTKTLA